ncbi:MAG: hypothetical protein JO258_18165 [Alphaproteobacteria bacterium]|nr:hypothetical protein [Alphaproteobacteria bacterium]
MSLAGICAGRARASNAYLHAGERQLHSGCSAGMISLRKAKAAQYRQRAARARRAAHAASPEVCDALLRLAVTYDRLALDPAAALDDDAIVLFGRHCSVRRTNG